MCSLNNVWSVVETLLLSTVYLVLHSNYSIFFSLGPFTFRFSFYRGPLLLLIGSIPVHDWSDFFRPTLVCLALPLFAGNSIWFVLLVFWIFNLFCYTFFRRWWGGGICTPAAFTLPAQHFCNFDSCFLP